MPKHRKIAKSIREVDAHYLLAVKANQPTLRQDVQACFEQTAAESLDHFTSLDKGHGRIEQRDVTVLREIDWLGGDRRFPGELRLPDVAATIKVQSRTQLRDRSRFDTRCFVTSAVLTAQQAATMVKGHWGIENQLHWILDVTFAEDQSRLRKGHGAKNMAVVRHFAINHLRQADEPVRPPNSGLTRNTNKPRAPQRTSIKSRRKIASWTVEYLSTIMSAKFR
jgi:predicted transposase YbfD/YdcC